MLQHLLKNNSRPIRALPLWLSVLAAWLGPVLIAVIAVLMEPRLTRLVEGREAFLPFAMFGLLFALVHPRLRQLLVVTLCYGVAVMAVRDIFLKVMVLPDRLASALPMRLSDVENLRCLTLALVAILATTAAVGESARPGTVWARRCYFGAAALYFTGIGLMNYVWHANWQSLLLCITGVTAFFGCIFADRIVASEQEEDTTPAVSDEAKQQLMEADHLRILREKEWRDHISRPLLETAEIIAPRSTPIVGP